MRETLINRGGEVKALGNGKVGGYLVRFSDAADPDLSRDFFTKDTDFGVDWDNDDPKSPVLYAHGLDVKMAKRRIGQGTMKMNDVGIWIEAQLSERDEYERAIADMATKAKLGWSSGTASHLVEREEVTAPDGKKSYRITHWPLGLDASLTPTPCEPKNACMPLKSWVQSKEVKDFFSDRLPVQLTVAALSTLQDQFWYRVTDILYGYSPDGSELSIPDQIAQIKDGFDEYQELALQTITSLLMNGAAEADEPAEEVKAAIKTLLISGQGGRPASLSLAEELDSALAAVSAVTARAQSANELRKATKEGRVLSSATRAKVQAAHGALDDLLKATEKPTKQTDTKDADLDALAQTQKLRTDTLRLQTRTRSLITGANYSIGATE